MRSAVLWIFYLGLLSTQLAAQTLDSAQHYMRQAQLHTGQTQYAEALTCLDKALVLNPRLKEAAVQRVICLYHLGRCNEARQQTLQMKPGSPVAWLHLGHCYRNQNMPAEALVAYDEVLKLDSNFYAGQYWKGSMLLQLGRYSQAVTALSRELARNPDMQDARLERGIAWYYMDSVRASLEDMEQVLSSSEGRKEDALLYRGIAFFKRKQWLMALVDFSAVLAKAPKRSDALYWRAETRRSMGDEDAALADCRMAAKWDTSTGDYHFRLAEWLHRIGERTDACVALREAKRLGWPAALKKEEEWCKGR